MKELTADSVKVSVNVSVPDVGDGDDYIIFRGPQEWVTPRLFSQSGKPCPEWARLFLFSCLLNEVLIVYFHKVQSSPDPDRGETTIRVSPDVLDFWLGGPTPAGFRRIPSLVSSLYSSNSK